jgi:hypothetical protein
MSIDNNRSILFVCHGPGRGRHPGYTQPITDYLNHEVPGLEAKVRIHETGSAPPRLHDVAAVVFWLADPLKELYPGCYAEATEIAASARGRGLRLVNPPESLSNSIKSVQSRLWLKTGIPTPPCRTFQDHDELRAILAESEPPCIVRPDHIHAHVGMHYLRDAVEVRALRVEDVVCPGIVVPFVDTRSSYEESMPGTLWARFYHKKRAMIFGHIVKPNHVFFSNGPIVALSESTYARYATRGHWYAALAWLRRWDRACVATDNAFWQGEPEQPDLMRHAARALGLDIMAIDYSTFADQSIIIWEANPYFYLPKWTLGVMPLQRRLRERIRGFYDALGAYLLELTREGESR